jgi:hypothetical protein
MVTALQRRRLLATGTRRGGSSPEKVPAEDWQGVVIDRLNNEPYLLLIGPAGEHDQHGGEYQDQLFMVGQQQGSKWWRLAVEQSDIRRLWPFNLVPSDLPTTPIAPQKPKKRRASPERDRVVAAMDDHVKAGKTTYEELFREKKETLATLFNARPTTAYNAVQIIKQQQKNQSR